MLDLACGRLAKEKRITFFGEGMKKVELVGWVSAVNDAMQTKHNLIIFTENGKDPSGKYRKHFFNKSNYLSLSNLMGEFKDHQWVKLTVEEIERPLPKQKAERVK